MPRSGASCSQGNGLPASIYRTLPFLCRFIPLSVAVCVYASERIRFSSGQCVFALNIAPRAVASCWQSTCELAESAFIAPLNDWLIRGSSPEITLSFGPSSGPTCSTLSIGELGQVGSYTSIPLGFFSGDGPRYLHTLGSAVSLHVQRVLQLAQDYTRRRTLTLWLLQSFLGLLNCLPVCPTGRFSLRPLHLFSSSFFPALRVVPHAPPP